jgi:cellulose biosynthesis protein BcsQ
VFGLKLQWSHSRLKYFLWLLVGAFVVSTVAAYNWWVAIGPWLKENETTLKLLSYVFGPLLALIGFVAGTKDKLELRDQAKELGKLQERASEAQKQAAAAETRAQSETAYAAKLRRELEGITKGADQLWKLRPPREFEAYRGWYFDTLGAKVVSIGNLKGGVGKTTIAANLAAYVSEVLHKRVLVIDLDYQGSLSTMLMRAVGRTDVESKVDALFASDADLATLQGARVHLVPQTSDLPTKISQGWLVPSGYSLARLENQLLFDWLLDANSQIDVRYRLAHALLEPSVRRDYDLIIIDLPPRLTLGAINALVASHFFFIPTILDGLSVEAVPQLLKQISAIKNDMDLGIEFAGVIGTMTLADGRSGRESDQLLRASELAQASWSGGVQPLVVDRTIPRRAAFSEVAGDDVALTRTPSNDSLMPILHKLFEDLTSRIGLR